MGDWIDDLVKQDKEDAKATQATDRAQLERSKVRAANLPLFWTALVEKIESDCEKLRGLADSRRHCKATRRSDQGIRIESTRPFLPRGILVVSRNDEGGVLEVLELAERELYEGEQQIARAQINVTADIGGALSFTWRGQTYLTPDKLAQGLIGYVIEA